jgi:hypothetical protein
MSMPTLLACLRRRADQPNLNRLKIEVRTQGRFEIGHSGHVANSNPGNGILRSETFHPRRANEPRRRWNRLSRPTTDAASRGNVVLFYGPGNHVGLHGLPGGAEGNRTPDLSSAIAALSRLIQSFLRLSLIATLPVSRPHAASREGHSQF